jgi:hypothetical protein
MNRFSTLLAATLFLTVPSSFAAKSDTGSDSPSESTWRRPGALLDRSPQRRPQMLSFFLGAPYGYGAYGYGFPVGVGARYLIPLVHDGFIPALNDSFNIEFGADFSFGFLYGFYPTIGLPVEVMWQFHFTQNFSAYAKAGISVGINPSNADFCSARGYCTGFPITVSPVANVGLMYKFASNLFFRAEVGYPWIKVGLGIGF